MGRGRLGHIDAGISGGPQTQKLFFIFLLFALAFVVLLFLRWLYSTNFGMAINAIRDDEEKAEAMGLYTRRYKRTAWTIAAFFPRHRGRHFRQHDRLHRCARHRVPDHDLQYFHDPDGAARRQRHILGPVVGAIIFHVIKEVTWTYFLGWQFVALGLLIVIIVVYFQQGIVGWLMEKYPDRFGVRVCTEGTRSAIACDRARAAR